METSLKKMKLKNIVGLDRKKSSSFIDKKNIDYLELISEKDKEVCSASIKLGKKGKDKEESLLSYSDLSNNKSFQKIAPPSQFSPLYNKEIFFSAFF